MATIKVDVDGFAAGTSSADRMYGDYRTNIIVGGKGNDSMWGGGGADLLDGGIGIDKLYGQSGDDLLSGGSGNDVLTGGKGKDAFVFTSKLGGANVDRITDFNVRDDSIWLDRTIFTKVGKGPALAKAAFWTGAAAHDANDRILYDKATGALYYDADGTGARAAVKFAQLKAGLALSYKDFFIL